MPAYLNDDVFDNGLSEITDATSVELHVTSDGAPADRSAAVSQSLASANLSSGALLGPSDASPDGRGVTVTSQAGVSVSSSGTPTHYCLIDGSRLLAYTEVDALSPDLVQGSTINVPSVDFSIGDPEVV